MLPLVQSPAPGALQHLTCHPALLPCCVRVQDTKFSYLWNCRAWLDQATKVVIATGEPRLAASCTCGMHCVGRVWHGMLEQL